MYKVALEILKILNKNNFEAYIVGGYPRDLYIGKESKDIDICTSAKYKDLKKLFKNIKDNKYGSYKLKYKNQQFEITTFRKEKKYINNRFPEKLKYTKKLKTDLKRRDFTINTLCIDKNGNYVDHKKAINDINNGIIRLVGNKKKIKDDSLRILRAIRFATVLNFKIDKKLEDAIKKYKQYLENLSYDRKKQELEKILKNKNFKYGLELIKKYGLEQYLKINIDNVNYTNNVIGMWAQIIIDNSYPFTKDQIKKIKKIIELKEKQFDRYDLYKYGPELLEIVDEIKEENNNIKEIYNNLQIKDRDEIDIYFFEISEMIKVTNRMMAEIYDDIEKQIVYNNIKNKKTDIKKYIKKNYKVSK